MLYPQKIHSRANYGHGFCSKIHLQWREIHLGEQVVLFSGDLRRLVNCSLNWATRKMTDWNKSRASTEDEKYVDSTFFVNMTFKFESFGSFGYTRSYHLIRGIFMFCDHRFDHDLYSYLTFFLRNNHNNHHGRKTWRFHQLNDRTSYFGLRIINKEGICQV